jgi:hypothetical protein
MKTLRILAVLFLLYLAYTYFAGNQTQTAQPAYYPVQPAQSQPDFQSSYYRGLHKLGLHTPCDEVMNRAFDPACKGYWK